MQKEEGATLIRVRWYGNSDPTREVYVERKLHHESWVQEKSAKSRFPLPADRVLSFFHDPKGKGKAASAAPEADDRASAARSSKPPKPLTAEELQLMEEVRGFVAEHPIRPMVATKYLRAAFQLPDDNSVRVSLDTDLSMIRERVAWGQEWYVSDDRLLDSDVHRFPYAVLEIKLQGGEASRPPWVSALLDSELLIPVEKFSKFGHGCAVLYNNQVPLLPYWFQGREAEFVREVRLPIVSSCVLMFARSRRTTPRNLSPGPWARSWNGARAASGKAATPPQ
jgi:SPX domain protein involved in polyphosphate accumulation